MDIDQNKSKPKILWLEDDLRLVEIFKEEFETLYDLKNLQCFSDLQIMSRVDLNQYAAILLDMELSDGVVGLSIIQYLKNLGIQAPILVLSNDESIKTRVNALKLGIEDYLWKAMHPEEMLVRLHNAISRYKAKDNENKISLSGLEIFPMKFYVTLNDQEIELTKIELQFIKTVIENHPNALTCDYLRKVVWRMPQVEIGTINTFIWKLNKKLSCWAFRISKDQENVFLVNKE